MNFRRREWVALVVVFILALAAVGAGVAQVAVYDNPDTSSPGSPAPGSPAATQSSTRFQGGVDASIARQCDWATGYLRSPHDYRALARTSYMAAYAAPPATLENAVSAASAVVVGRVTGVDFTCDRALGGMVSQVTLRVAASAKGAAAEDSEIRFTQYGGPVMDFATGGVRLAQHDPDPLLLPGDEAVLFLQSEGTAPTGLTAEYFTGQYRLADSVIQPVEGNPFAPEVDGLTRDTFLDTIAALTAE